MMCFSKGCFATSSFAIATNSSKALAFPWDDADWGKSAKEKAGRSIRGSETSVILTSAKRRESSRV